MKPLLLALLIPFLYAEEEPKPKTDKPVIPAEHSAEYFAAAAAFARIEPLYKQAQAALQDASAKVIADCGPNAAPGEGAAGKMTCEAKPEAAKSPAK